MKKSRVRREQVGGEEEDSRGRGEENKSGNGKVERRLMDNAPLGHTARACMLHIYTHIKRFMRESKRREKEKSREGG